MSDRMPVDGSHMQNKLVGCRVVCDQLKGRIAGLEESIRREKICTDSTLEVVKELEAEVERLQSHLNEQSHRHQAALNKLLLENTKLREAVMSDCDSGCPEHTCLSCCNDRRVQLEAENESLREALIKIRGWREIGSAVTPVEFLFAIEEIADKALKGGSDTPNVSYETPSVSEGG